MNNVNNSKVDDQVVDKIVGTMFLQSNLDKLHTFVLDQNNQKRVTASSLTAYICLHYLADGQGYIHKGDFSYTEAAEEYNLPYSSFYKGVQKLYELKLIQDEQIENRTYIRIIGFVEEQRKAEFNYFVLPNDFLVSDLPNSFIKARDTNGLIGVLDLLNQMYREHSISYSRKAQSVKVRMVRKYKGWMEKLKKTTRNIEKFIENLSIYFELKDVTTDEKRKRKKKVVLEYPDTTYEEVKEMQRMIYRATYGEVETFIRQTKFNQDKNIKRIASVVIEDVSKPLYYLSNVLNMQQIKHSIYEVFVGSLEQVGDIQQKTTIKNFIGLLRSRIRENIWMIARYIREQNALDVVKHELLMNGKLFPKHFTLPFFTLHR